MLTSIDAADAELYARDGYLVIPGFLSADELASLTEAVEATVRRIGRDRVVGNPDLAEPEAYRHRVAMQRLNLWKVDAAVRRVFMDPDLGRLLCDLEGIDGLRMWHDQTFFKPPWGEPTAYHLDLPNWSFTSPHGVQIWIALDDASRDNGCLYYLPGSHHLTGTDRTAPITGDVGALVDVYPALARIEPRAVELAAGGAVVHNGMTVHGAGANMTGRWRRAMTCQYMPDGATFNGRTSILTAAQLARLRIGDPLDDPSHNPIVFSRASSAS
jgi:ectoine hydroxylase-related dioxygenase (phytanoyl-CoA dioxygenase family)